MERIQATRVSDFDFSRDNEDVNATCHLKVKNDVRQVAFTLVEVENGNGMFTAKVEDNGWKRDLERYDIVPVYTEVVKEYLTLAVEWKKKCEEERNNKRTEEYNNSWAMRLLDKVTRFYPKVKFEVSPSRDYWMNNYSHTVNMICVYLNEHLTGHFTIEYTKRGYEVRHLFGYGRENNLWSKDICTLLDKVFSRINQKAEEDKRRLDVENIFNNCKSKLAELFPGYDIAGDYDSGHRRFLRISKGQLKLAFRLGSWHQHNYEEVKDITVSGIGGVKFDIDGFRKLLGYLESVNK